MSHPEDTCERCGGNNPAWFVESDRFNMAVAALGLTKVVIICPGCFVEGHELASGMHCSWKLVPATPFRWPDAKSEKEVIKPVCGLCGSPMPEGEEMFKYHGYSGPCPSDAKPERGGK